MTHQGKVNEKKEIHIVQTDRFFLYLPLHYAYQNGFFGYIPSQYEVRIKSASKHTDIAAYSELMQRNDRNRDVYFAVCDPTCLLKEIGSKDLFPVVLAGLITNAAFWAVNHSSNRVKSFRDLCSFEKIIAYEPGTTSYRIASRIFKESARDKTLTEFLELVPTGQELERLKDKPPGFLALSPDILGIDALLGTQSDNDKYDIEIALGTTPEYMNVLVTAILTREDVLADHPDLVIGLLRAIQLSMLRVRYIYPDVVKFAKDFYSEFGYRAEGALRRATEAQVFPPTIEINRVHWENAVRAEMLSTKEVLSEDDEAFVIELYEKRVKPYSSYAINAIREEILPRLSSEMSRPNSSTFLLPLLLGSGTTAGLFLIAIFVHWLAAILVGVEMFVAYWLSTTFTLHRNPRSFQLHCGIFVVAIVCSILLVYLWTRPPGFQSYMTAIMALVVAVIGWDLNLAMRHHKTESDSGK